MELYSKYCGKFIKLGVPEISVFLLETTLKGWKRFEILTTESFIIQYVTYTFIIQSLKLKLGDAAYIMVLNNAYIHL